MPKVIFGKHSAEAKPGEDVLGLLLDVGAPIHFLCMAGTCRTCLVRVVSGGEHLEPMSEAESYHFPHGSDELRLACQAIVRGTGDVVVTQDGL